MKYPSGISDLPEFAKRVPPEYIEKPTDAQIANGVAPLDSLPAQWWNWMWQNTFSEERLSKAAIDSLLAEIKSVLDWAEIIPDVDKTDQLYTALKKFYDALSTSISDLAKEVSDEIEKAIDDLKKDVQEIVSQLSDVIPAEASKTDQLTVKSYVDALQSLFQGNYENWDDVPEDAAQYPNGTPTVNDYMVVQRFGATDPIIRYDSDWQEKDWNITMPTSGLAFWHDAEGNLYLSAVGRQYRLGGDIWIPITWNRTIYASGIWHGPNGEVYYSEGNKQYQLIDGEWVDKVWDIAIDLYGAGIWRDLSGHIFYSYENDQFELENGEWVAKDWASWMPLNGAYVWNDGKNVYYSGSITSSQQGSKKLVNGEWVDITFVVKPWPTGNAIWTDGYGNYYHSDSQGNFKWLPNEEDWEQIDNWPRILGTAVCHDEYGRIFYGEWELVVDEIVVSAGTEGVTWRFRYVGVWAANGKNGWQREYIVDRPVNQVQNKALVSGVSQQLVRSFYGVRRRVKHMPDTTAFEITMTLGRLLLPWEVLDTVYDVDDKYIVTAQVLGIEERYLAPLTVVSKDGVLIILRYLTEEGLVKEGPIPTIEEATGLWGQVAWGSKNWGVKDVEQERALWGQTLWGDSTPVPENATLWGQYRWGVGLWRKITSTAHANVLVQVNHLQ